MPEAHTIRWTVWAAAVLAALSGAWMLFDGAHALATGDYVTPSSGEHAGQLGPWAAVLEALGLAPRSRMVQAAFVAYGCALVFMAGAYAIRRQWARDGLIVIAILGLWYLPFGTLLNAAAIVLVLAAGRGDRRGSAHAPVD